MKKSDFNDNQSSAVSQVHPVQRLGRSRPARAGFVLLLGAALSLSTAGCSTNVTDRDITAIATAQARQWSDQGVREPDRVLIVDTRTNQDFAAGHIPGARRMTLADLEDSRTLNSLRSFNTIVVYGRNPGDPAPPAFTKRLLAERKMGRVLHFPGGIEAWQRAGYSVSSVE